MAILVNAVENVSVDKHGILVYPQCLSLCQDLLLQVLNSPSCLSHLVFPLSVTFCGHSAKEERVTDM